MSAALRRIPNSRTAEIDDTATAAFRAAGKNLARVARDQGLDQERLRRWVSFLTICGVLETGND